MTRRPKLIITRGLPASGKSTRAREWVNKDPMTRAEVNRDSIRQMLHGGFVSSNVEHGQITAARDALITTLLRAGIDVISSDTNLPQRTARELASLGRAAGAVIEVLDLTNVSRETCIHRDQVRDQSKRVGADVINGMYNRYLLGHTFPLPLPNERETTVAVSALYVPPASKPKAIMVDIDGTVALMGDRSPYDESKVSGDTPNHGVIKVVRSMLLAGYEVIFCSGRTEACRTDTEKWLQEHVATAYVSLFMRAVGDTRKDSIVKLEIFDQHIRDNYNVVCVFDDRDQVVKAWRSIGLTVMQVAPGDF